MSLDREHTRRRAPRSRRLAIAGLLATLAAVAQGGSLAAQSAPAATPSSDAIETGVPSPFPSAEEVSELVGVDVVLRSIEPGLSQLWEGIDFDWQELPRAQVGMYLAPAVVTEEPLVGVIIDVAEFATQDDAQRHADAKFADYPVGFETDLSGDYVLTYRFESDEDVEGSLIVLRESSVIVLVTTFASDGTDTEAAGEMIVELVQSRLKGEA